MGKTRETIGVAVGRLGIALALMALLLVSFQPVVFGQEGPPAGTGVTLDDRFAEVARRAPGFGGAFVDGDTLKVYLLVPAERPRAEQAFVAVFGRERIPAGGIQVLQGQYSFRQLKAWHDRMGPLFDLPGAILTDIDEGTNRLRVGVEGTEHFGAVEQELSRLGVPRQAVNLEVTDPVRQVVALQDGIRPLEGGIQIQFISQPFVYSCTLGFNAIRAGIEGFVVNSHCTAEQGGVEDTAHYQPTYATENLIGTEIADPLYTNEKCPEGMPGNKICRWSDSAYSQRAGGVTADLGVIGRPDGVNTGSLTIAGAFTIVSEGPSLTGEILNKVGRTTGWTQGLVTDTCVNTGVQGSKIVQLCQDFVSAGVDGGDSGSPVFAITSGDDVQLRGILWGGSGSSLFVYSPIANIQRDDELGPITVETPPAVAIELNTGGSIQFGVQPLEATADTVALGQVQTVTVTTGPADLWLKTTTFSDGDNVWSLGDPANDGIGTDRVVWEFSGDGGLSWTAFTAADTVFPLAADVPEVAERDVYFQLTMPASTSSNAEHSVTVTIVATAP